MLADHLVAFAKDVEDRQRQYLLQNTIAAFVELLLQRRERRIVCGDLRRHRLFLGGQRGDDLFEPIAIFLGGLNDVNQFRDIIIDQVDFLLQAFDFLSRGVAGVGNVEFAAGFVQIGRLHLALGVFVVLVSFNAADDLTQGVHQLVAVVAGDALLVKLRLSGRLGRLLGTL